jgi:hypothetical protein
VNYNYSKQKKYQLNGSANYTKNFDYPSIDQLYTIVDDINVYNTRVGNPFLRNRINHSISLNSRFNTQKPAAIYSVNGNIGGSYNWSVHPTADSTINDPSGKRISYYINADKSNSVSLSYNLNVSRKLKKNSIQLMYNGQFSTSRFPNYTDRIYNISETQNLFNQVNLQFSLRTVFILNIGQSVQNYTSLQTAAGLRSFTNSSTTTRVGAVLNYPKNFAFSSTLNRIGNSNLATPTNLWNAFATYRFMKQQGELKFSAMDILKQYKNITNNVNAYGTTTRVTNGLQRYFLLTFSYFPRKFGKTDSKRQGS